MIDRKKRNTLPCTTSITTYHLLCSGPEVSVLLWLEIRRRRVKDTLKAMHQWCFRWIFPGCRLEDPLLQCAVVWNGIVGYRFDVKCGVRQGGVLSRYLFSVYIGHLIKELRQSGHGIHVGTVFVPTFSSMPMILCCSLVTVMVYKKMVDICSDYGNRFVIRLNSSKSQTNVFGGRSPPHFVVKLNTAPVPYVDTVKYLGVFINSRTNCVDPSAALRKFFGCFNNIMSVLGYCRGRPRLHVAGQRVVGVLKVARGRRSTSMVSVSTVSYRTPWSVGSVPRHLIFHAVIRV